MFRAVLKSTGKYLTSPEHRERRLAERFANYAYYIRKPTRLYHRCNAEREARKILTSLEMRAAEQIIEKFGGVGWGQKYSRLPRYIKLNLRRVYDLGLHKAPPCSVLDIGSGAGFFLYLGQRFGHTMLGVECVNDEFYTGMHDAFEVDSRPLAVEPFTPLPDFGRRFDLITAFAVCFHRVNEQAWTDRTWKFFIDDLRTRHLAPGGKIYLLLNDHPRGDRDEVTAHITRHFPQARRQWQIVTIPGA